MLTKQFERSLVGNAASAIFFSIGKLRKNEAAAILRVLFDLAESISPRYMV
ncbi:hypothetical protein [Lacticaseibacillus rhamnosus]|uniref:hypothetical protein n=1 Tax=Lacticaseibacillus rhamnosus TaxID=47715 RepID=UPI000A58FA8C|nr:hypothetical protein [Lacticaseibacillus rhamnosus]